MSAITVLLRPLTRTVTYTRWLHVLTGSLLAVVVSFVAPGGIALDQLRMLWLLVLPLPLLACAALVPGARMAEGLQARLMLLPGPHARNVRANEGDHMRDDIAAAPSSSWEERGRTALWLVLRLEMGCVVAWSSLVLWGSTLTLVGAAAAGPQEFESPWWVPAERWQCAALAPVAFGALVAVVVIPGAGMTAAARRLLGPSAAERLAAAEKRAEAMLERGRLAGELHDSIGHALTLSVVQAGAAREAGSAEFTERALRAIEESGREALDDLERVLRLLREDVPGPGLRPGMADIGRLLSSARAAGATVTAELHGPLDSTPRAVSHEGYRIVQEALTNALRHAGPVPVRVRAEAGDYALELEIHSALPDGEPAIGTAPGRRTGSGLPGIHERASLLGGHAETGPAGAEWLVRARLPLTPPPPSRGLLQHPGFTGALKFLTRPGGRRKAAGER